MHFQRQRFAIHVSSVIRVVAHSGDTVRLRYALQTAESPLKLAILELLTEELSTLRFLNSSFLNDCRAQSGPFNMLRVLK